MIALGSNSRIQTTFSHDGKSLDSRYHGYDGCGDNTVNPFPDTLLEAYHEQFHARSGRAGLEFPAARRRGEGSRPSGFAGQMGGGVCFYPKDNTSGCTAEAREFTELLPEFAALSAEVLGVSKDNVASHAEFAKKHDLKVRLLADPGLAVLIDPAGVVRETWPKVPKGAGHAAQVLATLLRLARSG